MRTGIKVGHIKRIFNKIILNKSKQRKNEWMIDEVDYEKEIGNNTKVCYRISDIARTKEKQILTCKTEKAQ